MGLWVRIKNDFRSKVGTEPETIPHVACCMQVTIPAIFQEWPTQCANECGVESN